MLLSYYCKKFSGSAAKHQKYWIHPISLSICYFSCYYLTLSLVDNLVPGTLIANNWDSGCLPSSPWWSRKNQNPKETCRSDWADKSGLSSLRGQEPPFGAGWARETPSQTSDSLDCPGARMLTATKGAVTHGMLHWYCWVIDLSLGPDKITASLDNCDGVLSSWDSGNKVVWAGQFTLGNPLTWSWRRYVWDQHGSPQPGGRVYSRSPLVNRWFLLCTHSSCYEWWEHTPVTSSYPQDLCQDAVFRHSYMLTYPGLH